MPQRRCIKMKLLMMSDQMTFLRPLLAQWRASRRCWSLKPPRGLVRTSPPGRNASRQKFVTTDVVIEISSRTGFAVSQILNPIQSALSSSSETPSKYVVVHTSTHTVVDGVLLGS